MVRKRGVGEREGDQIDFLKKKKLKFWMPRLFISIFPK